MKTIKSITAQIKDLRGEIKKLREEMHTNVFAVEKPYLDKLSSLYNKVWRLRSEKKTQIIKDKKVI